VDLVAFYNHGHWEVRTSKNCAFICCPLMDRLVSFQQKREIYQEIKGLEIDLAADGKSEIVAYTGIGNPHIMLMFTKLDYVPFYLSLKKKILWFKKEL
jgi:hypothetical protein